MTKAEALKIASEARLGLENIYGSRLRGIRLYGSWARGEGREDSDVDIAVVLDEIHDRHSEHLRLGSLQAELSLRHSTVVMLLPLEERVVLTGSHALARSISREGLPV